MKQINFNNHREHLTTDDINQIYDLLSSRLRARSAELLWKRLNDHLSLIPHHGILERLMKDDHGWSYCAGQSYPDEIRTIRNIILTLR